MKNQKGITLIALVITIIVLLILAGVSISMVIGENGILNQADTATAETRKAAAKEEVELAWASADADYWNDWTNNSSMKREDYYTVENLNKYLEGKGTVNNVTPNDNGTYTVVYTSLEDEMQYTMTIDANGNAEVTGSVHSSKILLPGFYDDNDILLASWEKFETYGVDIEINHSTSDMAFCNVMSCMINYSRLVNSGLEQILINNNISKEIDGTAKIILPDTITRIGTGVFTSCGMKEIILPDSIIEIGKGAFANSGLISITIPKGVTELVGGEDEISGGNKSVFGGSKNLQSVTIYNTLESIGYGVFQDCESLTDIYYHGLIDEWNQINLAIYDHEYISAACWNEGCPEITVHCTDGDIIIPASE